MQIINVIPLFQGSRLELSAFIDQMDVTYSILRGLTLDKLTTTSLWYMLLGGVAEELRREVGIAFTLERNEVKRLLKEPLGALGDPEDPYINMLLRSWPSAVAGTIPPRSMPDGWGKRLNSSVR